MADFTDSYSDNSYFIPTLRAQHLADQVLTDTSPTSNGDFTDSCSTLRAHIWQTKCSSTLRAYRIWQTRSWQICISTTSSKTLISQMTVSGISCCTCSSPKICLQIYPAIKHWFDCAWDLLHLHISWMAIPQIPALTALISFLLWELIIWHTRSWQIYPPSNGDFTDFCEILISAQ